MKKWHSTTVGTGRKRPKRKPPPHESASNKVNRSSEWILLLSARHGKVRSGSRSKVERATQITSSGPSAGTTARGLHNHSTPSSHIVGTWLHAVYYRTFTVVPGYQAVQTTPTSFQTLHPRILQTPRGTHVGGRVIEILEPRAGLRRLDFALRLFLDEEFNLPCVNGNAAGSIGGQAMSEGKKRVAGGVYPTGHSTHGTPIVENFAAISRVQWDQVPREPRGMFNNGASTAGTQQVMAGTCHRRSDGGRGGITGYQVEDHEDA